MRKYIVIACLLIATLTLHAQVWKSHFAYNNVTQIAVSPDKAYAISDGSLFSVEKQTEKIQTYDRLTGLHGTGIACIAYDELSEVLFIAYQNGKIDLLSSNGAHYVGDLYDKDMTQQKTVHNITFNKNIAYLSTHYGIQTLNIGDRKLVDSYWLRPGGEETPISDVLIANDSIYAFGLWNADTADSLFCAALSDNLVDYRCWHREKRSGRINPDADKGLHYFDGTDHWYAQNVEGIVRSNPTERIAYKPQGPLTNNPYRLYTSQGKVFVVPGGRWAVQYNLPGIVMIYDGEQWVNIPTDSIQSSSDDFVLDFMNVALDPRDKNHFFVTSYGTGLYEFQGAKCIKKTIATEDNPITSASRSNPARYTRLDGAVYDDENNLWCINAGGLKIINKLICLDASGEFHGLEVEYNGNNLDLETPAGLILDNKHKNYKWIGTARYNTCMFLLDDGGTPLDNSDDRVMMRSEWINQKEHKFMPQEIQTMKQDAQGRVWIGTEQGVAYIDSETDFFTSDLIFQPDVRDETGENPLLSQRIKDICFDDDDNAWIGTEALGVYVLNNEANKIIAHYTTANSNMPSNAILSLACTDNGVLYIGTSEGLVEFDPNADPHDLTNLDNTHSEPLEQGSMQQWRLHFSYESAQELAFSSKRIYAMAQGALYYLDRSNDQLEYLSKETGLHGSSVAHIAYDENSHQLIIVYEDGKMDLLDDEDNIRYMPDLYMKAQTSSMYVNSITVGDKYVYLAMSFGIIAIDPRKNEVTDTYYIGEEAGSVDVVKVIEKGDSLYAFSRDRMYSAALQDNLVDYHQWHRKSITSEKLTQAALYRDEIYSIQNEILYRYRDEAWQQVLSQPVKWMHVSGTQMLMSHGGQGIARLGDEDQEVALTPYYLTNDAVYTQGEYWLAEEGHGLIRLGKNGDDYFHTDGTNSNFGYFMCAAHDRIYVANGGRWASQYGRPGRINIYDGKNWRKINADEIGTRLGKPAMDIVSIAVDPSDAGHFFAATYGTGLFEFRNYEPVQYYGESNSTLKAVNDKIDPTYYTRTDGAMMDEDANLWVMNATSIGQPLHVHTANGQWHALPLTYGGQTMQFSTPTGIWVDNRDTNRKWMMDQRTYPGLILMDDHGTPTYGSDDRCIKRSSFLDQNGNTLTPSYFYCWAQDHRNRIWVGTDKGIITIPSDVDFFTSNSCRRIIIPRNDGTGLGDYLLGDEQINCMAVDGGNRMWIGTANSGLYLIEDDTITVAHFTENNSLLPSNAIQSIAILPTTGEVFVGTDKGIASYVSDASEPKEDLSNAYAFPNPVPPNYGGVISIIGLMDETVVNIVDAGGNLVCKTKSHGGTAVWDGKLKDGQRARSGVYTALCNEPNGKHTVVKILVIR